VKNSVLISNTDYIKVEASIILGSDTAIQCTWF